MTALSQIERSRTLPQGRARGAEPTRAAARVYLAAVLLALLLAVPMFVHATGTTAGTAISNTATLECDLCGAGGKTVSTVPFVVDAKINLTVGGGNNFDVSPGSLAQVSTFTVTNNANTPLDFSLAISQTAADDFDATACAAVVESGVTAGYQLAEDIATFIDELPADSSQTVYVLCNIPAGLANANTAQVDLAATAMGSFAGGGSSYLPTPGVAGGAITQAAGSNDAGAVDIVFADVAGTAAGDAVRDALHSARNTYTATAAATVGLTKIITKIEDTSGCVASVCTVLTATTPPTYQCQTSAASACKVTTGTAVTFRVDYTVTGSGAVNNVVLTDPIVSGMTYVPGSLTVDGVAKTDAADSDNAAFCSNVTVAAPCNVGTPDTVTVIPGNVIAPMSLWFTFRATIN